MSTKFFTNHEANTLLNKLEGVFEHNKDIEAFDALVGYFRASGYFAIRPFLNRVPKVRVLVGIDVDEIVSDYHKRGLLFLADPEKVLEDFRTRLKDDIQKANYSYQVEQGILQFVDDVVSGKLQIRAHPTKKLHAKIYIMLPEGFCEHRAGAVITGSSNLTAAGLGVEELKRNYEFNVLLHDYDDVKFASQEFDKLWDESVDVLPKAVLGVRDSTYLTSQITPFELYYKLLIEYFGASIDYDPNVTEDLPEPYKRLSYQADAVNSGYRLLEKHNGFFLSDVVGLGKTLIAALIAKKFFFHNGFPEHRSHTLVVCPPALEENWHETLERFRLDNVKITTTGSLHKLRNVEKYDLVIVDEAHKFRNDTAESFDQLQRICKAGTHRKLEDGTVAAKKVILVSATPLNNTPQDIRNLISLFQDLKRSTLSVGNLQHFFATAEKAFREAKKEESIEASRRAVVAIYESIRTKVISEIVVRRTRTDLNAHPEYKKDLDDQGIVFPEIEKPRHILYPLSDDLETLYDQTVALLSNEGQQGLSYNRYRALAYLRPELKKRYQNAERISKQLATIMRTLLVKRLDSSFYAFSSSLRRFHDATKVMIDMFERGTIYIAPKLQVSRMILEGKEEELIAQIEAKQEKDDSIAICKPDDFKEGLLSGLKSDLEKIKPLLEAWEQIVAAGTDPKFEAFNQYIRNELFDRDYNREGKLVVFSESKETTEYLKNRLAIAGKKRVLMVDASTRNEHRESIRANFDANYRGKHKNDYDILISTEVLAEGVNLHRANIVVNYDTPWNATRLMQRIGRVNRIGSVASRVYVYNFYPTAKVDDDIELKKKAIMKLQAFHSALGEDSQIYSTDEEVDTFGLFEAAPEDDERDERLQLLMELRRFRKDRPEQFRRIAKLPDRCRVGRADSERAGNTVAFIRNNHRNAFYLLKPDASFEEITITEAAKEFRAFDESEPSVPLHSAHHEQVNTAVKAFNDNALAGALELEAAEVKQGPNEKKALLYLDGFLSFDFVSDEEKNLIRLAKLAISRARWAKLQREVNKLQRDTKKAPVPPAELADKLFAILKTYKLQEMEQQGVTALDSQRDAESEPEIIISESFDTPRPQ